MAEQTLAGSHDDARTLATALRELATGTLEWRVQNPVTGSYCISFGSGDHNPERQAREWLDDHRRQHPNSTFAGYEAKEVRSFSRLEEAALKAAELLEARDREPAPVAPSDQEASAVASKLTVWFGPMPESNGKTNWTAILHRGDLADGFTVDRSEHHDRVRYEADRVRWLVGEIQEAPFILDYDADMLNPEGFQHPCRPEHQHQLKQSMSDTCLEDIMLWADGTWCYREQLSEMNHMSDDYEVLLFNNGRNLKYWHICAA